MSKQLFETLLAKLKRAGQERKLKLANEAGYSTVNEYTVYLTRMIEASDVVDSFDSTPKTIHIVDVLDCSGSMSGAKIRNATKGINEGIAELKTNTENVKYTYSVCDFASRGDINYKHFIKNINKVQSNLSFNSRGMTALYDAIGETILAIKKEIKRADKVLVNIYTDGGENGSRDFDKGDIAELIKSTKDQITVTFIGTEDDTRNMIRNLNIDESNTLSYDGTAAGLDASLQNTRSSRVGYATAVSKGEDVSKGFYKQLN